MAKREVIGIFLVLIATVATVAGIFAYKSTSERGTITLLARAPENGNWSPQTIRVEKGEKVNLLIKNVDVVSHGFYVPVLNIVVKELKAGEVMKIDFTAEESGDYPFYCVLWCSDYHMYMRGKIIVR
jgi:heme/copper-type cytochrome/quinol oxidase subunit 2